MFYLIPVILFVLFYFYGYQKNNNIKGRSLIKSFCIYLDNLFQEIGIIKKISYASAGNVLKGIIKNILYVLFGFGVSLLILFALLTSLHAMNEILALQLNKSLDMMSSYTQTAFVFLMIVLNNAFWEELIFRGFFQNIIIAIISASNLRIINFSVKKHAGAISIFITSCLFTLIHFLTIDAGTGRFRILQLMLASIVYGALYHNTRNIWIPSYGHAFYNYFIVFISNFVKDRAIFACELLKNFFSNTSNLGENEKEIIKNVCMKSFIQNV